ncbi:hypothetical protein CQW23_03658 [Capsicum baccatum]|uniref:Ubiquitin-like protease family profile domain-containing protein n=1 Tax=Capsicum baccatum TaxID=33114 RepID=A0A2G2XCD9_CAPBA|nr:hypothetical protein CQW23_03658 [Capsicum baccatum]
MAELVTLISKIPTEVVKALKNEQNKQSQEDKIDEQQQSQEDGSNKQERQHKSDMQHEDYDKGSLNDMEVSRDEESNKQHLLEEQQLLDVNAGDKDADRKDKFENEDCSYLQALEDEIMAYEEEDSDEDLGKKNIPDVEDLSDVNLTAKEDVTKVNLKNQKSTNVTNVQDEVGGTITDSIQLAIDTLLFGLSTPSTTKSLDVVASNKMTERHWDLPDSQIPPDFPDAQVWELQASKSKAPAKRERKKYRILRSPYISKYGSGSKDAVDIDKEEKLKYAFDGYNINQDLPNELMIDYSQWIVVGLLNTHSAKKETDNHYQNLDVIFYYLRKKSKIQLGDNYRYTTTSCFFKTYVEKTHTRYYPSEPVVDPSTQKDYAESIVVAKNEDAIANIIQKFCMSAGLPWYMVDETERTDWPSLEAYKGKITQQTGLVNEISFDVDYVQNIPQQASDSLDCGVFVCAYAEILSEGLQVHSCGFDSACQRARYASLL